MTSSLDKLSDCLFYGEDKSPTLPHSNPTQRTY